MEIRFSGISDNMGIYSGTSDKQRREMRQGENLQEHLNNRLAMVHEDTRQVAAEKVAAEKMEEMNVARRIRQAQEAH